MIFDSSIQIDFLLYLVFTMENLLNEIRKCTFCKTFLPNPPRPIVQASMESKIILIGQAPGQRVQNSGIPWDDASGKELRRWLDISPEIFYDPKIFALVPMGFCFPGRGKSGDLPPRPECAPLWHIKLMKEFRKPELILLIGQYAHKYYLGDKSAPTLTENVRNFRDFLPDYIPLVHPSPRNRIWQKRNPWFELELIPDLQLIMKKFL